MGHLCWPLKIFPTFLPTHTGGLFGAFWAVLGGAVRCRGRSVEFPTISSLPFHEYDISSAVNLNATQSYRSGRYADSPAFGLWQQAPDHASTVHRRERHSGAGIFKGDAEDHTRGEASGHPLPELLPGKMQQDPRQLRGRISSVPFLMERNTGPEVAAVISGRAMSPLTGNVVLAAVHLSPDLCSCLVTRQEQVGHPVRSLWAGAGL